MIKKESRTDISIDADDDIVLIPTPQVFSSNRSGGTNVVVTIKDEPSCSYDVKEEIIEDESEEHVSDAVEIMSESSSDGDFEDVEEAEAKSSDDKEEDDLFADVFRNKDNVGKLDVIVKEVELFSSNEIGKRKTTSENTIGCIKNANMQGVPKQVDKSKVIKHIKNCLFWAAYSTKLTTSVGYLIATIL